MERPDIFPFDPSQRPVDPVIEFYKQHVDRARIRENLRLTPDQRLHNLDRLVRDRAKTPGMPPMANDRLFVLQVVIAIEERWFAACGNATPIRVEREYRIDNSLFAAADEEAAFQKAQAWVTSNAFADDNHDGPGDVTRIWAIGIHQLEEVARIEEVAGMAREIYGLDLPGFYLGDVDANGVPLVRKKEELEVFRLQNLPRHTSISPG